VVSTGTFGTYFTRAQATDPTGVVVDDFSIQAMDGIVNVLNAPSPAATASIPIGRGDRRRSAPLLRGVIAALLLGPLPHCPCHSEFEVARGAYQ